MCWIGLISIKVEMDLKRGRGTVILKHLTSYLCLASECVFLQRAKEFGAIYNMMYWCKSPSGSSQCWSLLISITFVFLLDITLCFKQKVSNLPLCRWNVHHLHHQKAHIKHLHLSSVIHKKERVRPLNTLAF